MVVAEVGCGGMLVAEVGCGSVVVYWLQRLVVVA